MKISPARLRAVAGAVGLLRNLGRDQLGEQIEQRDEMRVERLG